MTKKDYLEFIFFMCCTFFTLIIFDLFWGINTGMSFNDNCIIGNIDEFTEDLLKHKVLKETSQ